MAALFPLTQALLHPAPKAQRSGISVLRVGAQLNGKDQGIAMLSPASCVANRIPGSALIIQGTPCV